MAACPHLLEVPLQLLSLTAYPSDLLHAREWSSPPDLTASRDKSRIPPQFLGAHVQYEEAGAEQVRSTTHRIPKSPEFLVHLPQQPQYTEAGHAGDPPQRLSYAR